MKSFPKSVGCGLLISALGLGAVACNPVPNSPAKQQELSSDAIKALNVMEREDPGLQRYLSNAYAYAILPNIGQGAIGLGGAHGDGEVYQNGALVGYVDVVRVSAGPQLGGREFSELIVFRTPSAFNSFTNNNLKFEAGAEAVILKSGASAEAKWHDDIAVFTRDKGGAMAGAQIGGQKFTYRPVSAVNPPANPAG